MSGTSMLHYCRQLTAVCCAMQNCSAAFCSLHDQIANTLYAKLYKHNSAQYYSIAQSDELASRSCKIAWHSHRMANHSAGCMRRWCEGPGKCQSTRWRLCSWFAHHLLMQSAKWKYSVLQRQLCNKSSMACVLSCSLAIQESSAVSVNRLMHKAWVIKLQ